MRRVTLLFILMILSIVPVYAQDTAPTIVEIVQSRPDLTTLANAITLAAPDILENLDNPESSLTLFAPTDAAFATLDQALSDNDSDGYFFLKKETLDAVLADTELLTDLLLYHVVDDAIHWDDLLFQLRTIRGITVFVALNGDVVTITATFDNTGKIVTEQGVRLNGEFQINLQITGIEASNGVVYVIDGVLLPETRTIAEILADDAAYEEYPEFTILMNILETADPAILELLNQADADVMLFAPYDSAFESMSQEELDGITTHSQQATEFITHYIASDLIYSFQLADMLDENGILEVEMTDASITTITLPEERYYGEFYLNDVLIGFPDRVAKNGLIHEIEMLISSPSEE